MRVVVIHVKRDVYRPQHVFLVGRQDIPAILLHSAVPFVLGDNVLEDGIGIRFADVGKQLHKLWLCVAQATVERGHRDFCDSAILLVIRYGCQITIQCARSVLSNQISQILRVVVGELQFLCTQLLAKRLKAFGKRNSAVCHVVPIGKILRIGINDYCHKDD